MLTVREDAKHIIPYEADFGGHEFFEASSMRKVGEKYYFVFSSQKNHELCYAISDYPDRDFTFGGTIVSNGDVGINGISDENRMNMTGTTHGSIIEISGQWYVFYHRLTHKSDYSRQACAERISISDDGTITQVKITSCGLNGAPLAGVGRYPAPIACCITNGRMPHGSNSIYTESFPNVTHSGNERYIGEVCNNTLIGFRYFEFSGTDRLSVTVRGKGGGTIGVYTEIGGDCLGEISVLPCEKWTEISSAVNFPCGVYPLYLVYHGTGKIDVLDIAFPQNG